MNLLFNKLTSQRNMSTEIVSIIKDKLLDGSLKPGDKLPTEVQLVEQLGVSRTPVREAIKILESIGVIHIRRGEGTFITKDFSHFTLNPLLFSLIMHNNNVSQLIEFRQHFEVLLMNMIIINKNQDDIKKIEEVYHSQVKRMKPNLSAEELADIDLEFHYAVLEATKNPFIIEIGKTIYELYKPKMVNLAQPSSIDRTLKTHFAYLQILLGNDKFLIGDQVQRMIINNREWLEGD